MNKDKLIGKWLNNSLSHAEKEHFNALDEAAFLEEISAYAKLLKAPEFDADSKLVQFKNKYATTKENSNQNWLVYFGRVAATIVVFLGLFFGLSTYKTNAHTGIAETESITLPDNSKITLNTVSIVSYNPLFWFKNRSVTLDGEAFFEVEKGSSFSVETKLGTVTVTGTKFLVKQRVDVLEVACYEGSVVVKTPLEEQSLVAGEKFLIYKNNANLTQTSNFRPTWIDQYSQFDTTPISMVLSEFERQYDVKFKLINVESETLFTGQFSHVNLNEALKSITIPLGYTFEINAKIITIKNE